ncbi:MAG: ABC transporter permease, partial [Lachnospiraceae bacterium]|nr:ABC transporter permease [Lachnospiraceae bacterium]
VHGKEIERDFVLSGWWEADPVFNVSIMVASRAYVDAHIDELYNDYKDSNELTGVINSYIMFKNSVGLADKLDRVITESGYSPDENDPNYIANNVNWSYLSTNINMDAETLAALVLAVLLVIFTGYLIIYNIFQISVIRDIRFYGLLKTIGTTGKQIGSIIRYQALLLSCIGIPIGLVLGYLAGRGLIPVIMEYSYYASNNYQVSMKPLVFIGSTLFALVTVGLSTAKPGRIASRVSPVEAVRYTDNDHTSVKSRRAGKRGMTSNCAEHQNAKSKQRKPRKSEYGTKITGMAAANMGRNRKRTILVILSMTLSLVLFNTIYTFSLGFDMDKYLGKFVDTDFLAAHADYFLYRFAGAENETSESMIESIEQQPGFEQGGRIYGNIRDKECFRIEYDGEVYEGKDNLGNYICALYGAEDLPLERLWVLEGEIDMEKLKSGDYILEGVDLDDYDNPK